MFRLKRRKGLLTWETALLVVAGLAGVRVVFFIIDYLADFIIVGLLWRAEQYISTRSFNKLLELSLDYHEKVSTGTKINILNKGKDKLINLLETFMFEFQPIVLQLVITSLFMLITNWRIGFIFTLSLIPFVLITIKTYQSTRKLRGKRHNLYEISIWMSRPAISIPSRKT